MTESIVSVDRLLSQHGFTEMASARHQLSIAISLHKKEQLKQQAQLRTLAEAVLEAHKGKGGICADCQHVEYGEDYQRCRGGEHDCCKCTACKLAREIIGGGEC